MQRIEYRYRRRRRYPKYACLRNKLYYEKRKTHLLRIPSTKAERVKCILELIGRKNVAMNYEFAV